jgi:hypothetical protein
MRLSEIMGKRELPTVEELFDWAQLATKKMIENGDMKLINDDNCDQILDKYVKSFVVEK